MCIELVEVQRSVIHSTWQAEAVFHKSGLSCSVARIHSPYLRQCHMALVHYEEKVTREMVHKGKRSASCWTSSKNTGIILYTAAIANFFQHFHVVVSALLYTLSLYELVILLKIVYTLRKFPVYLIDCRFKLVVAHNIVRGRKYSRMRDYSLHRARYSVDLRYPVYLITEVLHTDSSIRGHCREYLHNVAPYPEPVALEGNIVPLVAYLYKLRDKLVSRLFSPLTY